MDYSELGQAANWQYGGMRPTKVPSGHCLASIVQANAASSLASKVALLDCITALETVPKSTITNALMKINFASDFILITCGELVRTRTCSKLA